MHFYIIKRSARARLFQPRASRVLKGLAICTKLKAKVCAICLLYLSRNYAIIVIEREGESIKDKLRRFNEAIEQAKRECCIWCPCTEGCDKIPEEDNTPCETILFLYVETGETENFSKYL